MLPVQGALRGTFVVRPLSAAAAESSQQQARADSKQARARAAEKDALAVDEAQFDAITDQIPQRPMGVVEGTSYTLLILAGVAVAGAQGLWRKLQSAEGHGEGLNHTCWPSWAAVRERVLIIYAHRPSALALSLFPWAWKWYPRRACISVSHWHALHSAFQPGI